MHCRLSVIVASYNYERFIGKVLDCLIGQTRKDFEVIIVDDGSKDSSVKIIKEYVLNYRNLKLLQHQDGVNKGLSSTVQLGIKHSRGEYIAFCESDDFWEKDHVEHLYKFIDENPDAGMIYNRIKCINNSSYSNYDSYVEQCNNLLLEHSGTNFFEKNFLENWMPTFSAACVKKELLSSCDFNSPIRPYLDFWLWRQICLKSKVYFVNNSITLWNKHDASYDMTHNVSDISQFIYNSNNLIIGRLLSHNEKLKYFDKIDSIETVQNQIAYQKEILKKYIEE